MCAGTVVEPPVPLSAASVSVTSRSRSVAFSDNLAFSARTSTLPRIGMVLRRSTTRCTWPSDFRSCARSTVTFIAISARSTYLGNARRCAPRPIGSLKARPSRLLGERKVARECCGFKGPPARFPRFGAMDFDPSPFFRGRGERRCSGCASGLLLQLPLQRLDLFRQRGVLGDQRLDLAHGMQHGGVVAAAEAPADL